MAPLFIDGIVFSLQAHGGITVYFRQLLSRLVRDQVSMTLSLYEPTAQTSPITDSDQIFRRRYRQFERYRPCELPSKVGLFHSTYYRKPEDDRTPSVVTVHDFTYERCSSGPRRWVHSAQKFASIRTAQAVICVSNATRDDLIELVGVTPGQTLHVIHNGVDEVFTPLAAVEPSSRFVLFVGQRAGYKNFDLALRTMAYLPELELLCVGGGPLRSEELACVPEQVRRRIRHTGFVNDDQLNQLYNEAVCLLYPSRYEGFGIPVIEAMRAGCPVLCVECRAVIEVGREALTVAADGDPAEIAKAIQDLMESAHRALKVRAGFAVARDYSWERTYQQTRAIYRSLGLP
jgi:mannosyltransferase